MSQEAPTDHALLVAWKRGDNDAGDRLIDRHFPAVYRFFASKLDRALADDLAQETFTHCLEGVERFEARGSFRAFLLGIARHRLFKFFRKREREGRAMAKEGMSVEEYLGSPSGMLAARNERQLLRRAMRRISVDLQIALELYYWERMPLEEIGGVLDIPKGTVKSRLARAREALREMILNASAPPSIVQSTSTNLEKWALAIREDLDLERR